MSIPERPLPRPDDREHPEWHSMAIFTGRANPQLARDVSQHISEYFVTDQPTFSELSERFPDGEIRVRLPDVRNKSVTIIQSTPPPADNILELEFAINAAAKSGSAREVTAVIPYYGYARQDKPTRDERSPLSGSLIARTLERAGANRIVTVDLHNESILGSVDIPWEQLYGSKILIPEIRARGFVNPRDFVVVSPDPGGTKRAEAFAERLGNPGFATMKKDKPEVGEAHAVELYGNVEGADCVLVDDMIDGGSTITTAAHLLRERGAGRILVAVTHGLFTKNALTKIDDAPIDEVLVTDTIAHRPAVRNHPKITIISIAPLLGDAIRVLKEGGSIRELTK